MPKKKKTDAWDVMKDSIKPDVAGVVIQPVVSTKIETKVTTKISSTSIVEPISADDNFEKALQYTLWIEGGYVNNKNDHGGPTNLGVTQETYDSYRRQAGLARQSVKLITQTEAKDVYRKLFFDKAGCDKLQLSLSIAAFDFACNSSPGRAVIFLQRIVGTSADGDFGPNTSKAITDYLTKHSLDSLLGDYLMERFNFFLSIVHGNSSQEQFLRGWLKRMVCLTMYIQSDYILTKEIKAFSLPKEGYVAEATAIMNKLLKR